jgi:hypothetical protein
MKEDTEAILIEVVIRSAPNPKKSTFSGIKTKPIKIKMTPKRVSIILFVLIVSYFENTNRNKYGKNVEIMKIIIITKLDIGANANNNTKNKGIKPP